MTCASGMRAPSFNNHYSDVSVLRADSSRGKRERQKVDKILQTLLWKHKTAGWHTDWHSKHMGEHSKAAPSERSWHAAVFSTQKARSKAATAPLPHFHLLSHTWHQATAGGNSCSEVPSPFIPPRFSLFPHSQWLKCGHTFANQRLTSVGYFSRLFCKWTPGTYKRWVSGADDVSQSFSSSHP